MPLTVTDIDDGIGMGIATTVARYAQCKSRQIGATIMYRDTLIGWGSNGAIVLNPCKDCSRSELRSGEGLGQCPAIHAEVSAICMAASAGNQTLGATMYVTCGVPCKDCMNAIIAAGITRVVCANVKDFYDDLSRMMVDTKKVKIEAYVKKINRVIGHENWLDTEELE